MKNVNLSLRAAALSLLLFVGMTAFAQNTVQGTVLDAANGEPIIGASILEIGTTNGTITDFDGNFVLNVKEGAKLSISYMGYKTQELDAKGTLNVKLSEDTEVLDEVVVVGYGVVRKNDATGSVTAIKPDEMNKGLTTTATDMLSGKIAGVTVTNGGGTPGGGATIRIRGGSSLNASNDPLIVIDGLAMDNGGIPGAASGLSMVNPSDIETFTVLKDASATAIYGSRASNGVIIITTKKGQAGQKMKVTYDGNVSFGTLTNRLETLNGDEIRAYATALGYNKDQMKFLGTENTNWQDQVYRTAISTDHNISLMGGVKNPVVDMPYRASVGYTLNNGTIKTSQMQRVTAALSLSPSFLDKHLSFNLNAKGMYIYNSYEPGVVGASLSMDPTQPVKVGEDGVRGIYGDMLLSKKDADLMFAGYYQPTQASEYGDNVWTLAPKSNTTTNPVSALDQQSSIANSAAFVGNFEADYKIHGFEDLRLHANFGADYSWGKQRFVNLNTSAGSHYYGWEGVEEKRKYNLQFNCYAQYYKDFNENQHFDIMAGYEWQHFYNDGSNVGNGLYPTTNNKKDENGNPLAGQKANFSSSTWASESYLVSFFGRANYIGWNQLMITASFRADGSSRFAPEHRWGYFPSAALGWKIKETFMKDVNWLNDLKLRLGYGITGQQEIGNDYPYLAKYLKSTNYQVYYPVGGDNLATENKALETVEKVTDNNGNVLYYSYRPEAYNYDLTWEKTSTYNVGIDFAFLNNRISGNVDYYYRKTDDLLNTVTVAAGTNFRNRVTSNVGSLTNQGVEFALNAVILDYGRRFKWDFGYNFTWNENKIVRLNTGENQTAVPTGGISSGTGNTIQQHAVGHAASSFYVYEAQSATREDGTKYWYVVDRDNNGKIDENDKYYFHSPAAPYSMGFQMKFQFYDFDLGMSFRANIGNYVYNDVKASSLQNITRENFNKNNFVQGLLKECFSTYYEDNMRSDQLYATPEGLDSKKFDKWFQTDYFVENASFLRCDNITLGWSFKRPKISGRVYGTVSNPFVISKYSGLDPEVFGGIDNNLYPRSMTTTIGVNLQF
ncbi:MAG: SusC/RagA family TonB-linked outer membrane protein [Paludibacteraceae bacterium]|nr:SusC/RagA family TonB-linked outer membrane protein [Paludibacteraceae bacterium]